MGHSRPGTQCPGRLDKDRTWKLCNVNLFWINLHQLQHVGICWFSVFMLFLVLGPYTTHSYGHGEPPSRVGPVGSLSSAWSHCQPVVCEALPSAQLTPHRHLSWYTDRRISLNLGWVKEKQETHAIATIKLALWTTEWLTIVLFWPAQIQFPLQYSITKLIKSLKTANKSYSYKL